jgi:hypothetical protein
MHACKSNTVSEHDGSGQLHDERVKTDYVDDLIDEQLRFKFQE